MNPHLNSTNVSKFNKISPFCPPQCQVRWRSKYGSDYHRGVGWGEGEENQNKEYGNEIEEKGSVSKRKFLCENRKQNNKD